MPFTTSASIAPREDLYGPYAAYDPFGEDGFVADLVLPPWDCQEFAGQFQVIARDAMQQVIDGKVALTAPAPESRYAFGSDSYTLYRYAFRALAVLMEARKYKTLSELQDITTQYVASIMHRMREVDTAAAVFNDTTFATVGTNRIEISAGAEWDNSSGNGLPVSNVRSAKEYIVKRFGVMPDTVVMNYYLFSRLGLCTEIKNALGDQRDVPGELPIETVKMLFGVDKIIVPKGVKNTANPGATVASSYIWGSEYCMVCKTSSDRNIQKPQLGRTFQLDGQGLKLEVYEENNPKGNWVHAEHIMGPKIMSEPAGVLITNCAA